MQGKKLVLVSPVALALLALCEAPASVAGASQGSVSPFGSITARFGIWDKSSFSEGEAAAQEKALAMDGAASAGILDAESKSAVADSAQPKGEEAVEAKKSPGLVSRIVSFVPSLLFHVMCLVTYIWYSRAFYTPKAIEVKQRMQRESQGASDPSGAEVFAEVKKESPNTAVALESLEAMVMTSLLTVVGAVIGKQAAEEAEEVQEEEVTGIATEEEQTDADEEDAGLAE